MVAMVLSGCSARIVDLTVVSSKNMDIHSPKLITGKRVVGESSVPIFLFLPLGNPDIKEAIDDAIEQDRCAVGLQNAALDQVFFDFIFGFIEYKVEGDLIIDKNKTGCDLAGINRQR